METKFHPKKKEKGNQKDVGQDTEEIAWETSKVGVLLTNHTIGHFPRNVQIY